MVTPADRIELWNALLPLRSAASFMMTGAHPDDELSGLLARLAKQDGIRTIYVCATRGQGGQNALGPESGDALAALRTREMEEAARVLDMEIHWLDRGFGDPLADFGFAKTAEAAHAVWGEDRLLERLVRAIRLARPDIICPTFLDVPGQHGHHRAVTKATIRAFEVAADPDAFPDQIAAGLTPWRIAKLYLPAFSGAGGSYDDTEAPPPATVTVDIAGRDAALDATYAEIGQRSRARHRSQGMDVVRGEKPTSVPLHLLKTRGPIPNAEESVLDGLPRRLFDFADGSDDDLGEALRRADAGIDTALARFPDFDGVAAALHRALRFIEEAEARLAPPPDELADTLSHRLAIKRHQIARASCLALALDARVEIPSTIVAGERVEATLSVRRGDATAEAAFTAVAADGSLAAPDANGIARLAVPAPTPFPARFDPLSPAAPVVGRLRYIVDGAAIDRTIAPTQLPQIVPPLSLAPVPSRVVVRAGTRESLLISVTAQNHTGEALRTRLRAGGVESPALTLAAKEKRVIELKVPVPGPGRHRLTVAADDVEHGRVRLQDYPHTGRTGWIEPAEIEVLVADLAVPDVGIGYVEGSGDNVAEWLRQLGMDVTTLDERGLAKSDLGRFGTIVVGIKAFSRPVVARAARRLNDFVRDGGHLVTQYHRRQDGWDPKRTPPAELEIGQPSIRWRVCDPAAPVTVMVPIHPLMTYPNRIGPEDWEGWRKERGLYFASSWDIPYVPLVSLSDPGEAALTGGLLSARIGKGRHTHVSLSLAHQMDMLVPGAFRLFANLVQPAASR